MDNTPSTETLMGYIENDKEMMINWSRSQKREHYLSRIAERSDWPDNLKLAWQDEVLGYRIIAISDKEPEMPPALAAVKRQRTLRSSDPVGKTLTQMREVIDLTEDSDTEIDTDDEDEVGSLVDFIDHDDLVCICKECEKKWNIHSIPGLNTCNLCSSFLHEYC